MYEVFRIHKDITEEDGAGWEDPAVETHHQHGRDVQPGTELSDIGPLQD